MKLFGTILFVLGYVCLWLFAANAGQVQATLGQEWLVLGAGFGGATLMLTGAWIFGD